MSNACAYTEVETTSTVLPEPAAVARSRVKRGLDVVSAVILILFLAPLLGCIALAVVCSSKGPALFRQRRTGLNGRVFVIYKFRTMRVMEDGPELRQARADDDRVTPLGRVLRRSSLDELPQIFNVLKGDMSMVGPRPHAVAHEAQFATVSPDYWTRYRARPGITGLAQISGHRGEFAGPQSLVDRVEQDLCYIRRWSLWLDARIALATLPRLFRDPKAY